MPRYFFHLFNDVIALDEEGQVLPSDAIALNRGRANARVMAADSVSHGKLNLDHRLEVQSEEGETIGTIYFRDVIDLKGESPVGPTNGPIS